MMLIYNVNIILFSLKSSLCFFSRVISSAGSNHDDESNVGSNENS